MWRVKTKRCIVDASIWPKYAKIFLTSGKIDFRISKLQEFINTSPSWFNILFKLATSVFHISINNTTWNSLFSGGNSISDVNKLLNWFKWSSSVYFTRPKCELTPDRHDLRMVRLVWYTLIYNIVRWPQSCFRFWFKYGVFNLFKFNDATVKSFEVIKIHYDFQDSWTFIIDSNTL